MEIKKLKDLDLKVDGELYLKGKVVEKEESGDGLTYNVETYMGDGPIEEWMDDETEVLVIDKKIKVPKKVAEILENNSLYDFADGLFNGNFHINYKFLSEWLDTQVPYQLTQKKFELLCNLKEKGYEIEEPLGVILIDVHDNQHYKFYFVRKNLDSNSNSTYSIGFTNKVELLLDEGLKITKSEAEREFPNFKWVALEELENDK